MGRSAILIPVVLMLLFVVFSSGCVGTHNGPRNETTEYEYYNISNETASNGSLKTAIKDFTFKINGDGEFWMKANDSVEFDVVFNNFADDEGNHTYVAKVFPSAADFDVMAAFQCLYFAACDSLLSSMRLMLDQPEEPILVDYGYVGLYSIGIRIPDKTPSGTYMFNMIACMDLSFGQCDETSTNFGPNVPITVHVI
jgi:hypothetical protein